jgi:hypothetical protein
MTKPKNKITYETLRDDAVRAGDMLAAAAEKAFATGDITSVQRAMLVGLARMLKGATHIVIHDTATLPED